MRRSGKLEKFFMLQRRKMWWWRMKKMAPVRREGAPLLTCVGERSMNFKKKSYAHARSIHGDASLREGRVCLRTLIDH
jgi:hypothetical protein